MKKCIVLALASLLLVGCANPQTPDSIQEGSAISQDEKESFYYGTSRNEIETGAYGVGRGINVLTAEYIKASDTLGNANVFDGEKILSKKWTKISENKSDVEYYQSTSIETYYEQRKSGYSTKFSVDAHVPTELIGLPVPGTFTASIETGVATSNEVEESKANKEVITHYYANVHGYTIALEGYKRVESFSDAISDEFASDLEDFYDNKKTAEDLFSTYGTHVIMGGIYGGRYDILHHYLYNSKDSGTLTQTQIASKIKVGLDLTVAGATAGVETKSEFSELTQLHIENSVEKLNFSIHGGRMFDVTNFNSFNDNFKSWLESLDSIEGNYSTLIDLPEQSLLPIWSLIPNSHSDKAKELGHKFYELGGGKESAFLSKFMRQYHEEVQPEDITIVLEDQIQSCLIDNGFNPNEPETNQLAVDEVAEAIDIVDLKLNGCKKVYDDDNNFVGYKMVEPNNFGFDFVTKQDPFNLNLTNPVPAGSTLRKIEVSDDSASYIHGVGQLQKEIDRGTVYYEYTYTDGDKSYEIKYNIFDGLGDNSTIPLGRYSDFKTNQYSISSVKIIYVFELIHLIHSHWWFGEHLKASCYTTWRVDLTLNFVNN